VEDRQSLDLAYLVLGYDWDQALQLSPSDKVELIKRTFGAKVSTEKANELIILLSQAEVYKLWNEGIPGINEYLGDVMDGLDRFILELNSVAILKPSHEEMRERVVNTTRRMIATFEGFTSDDNVITRIGTNLLNSLDVVERFRDEDRTYFFLLEFQWDVKWLALLKESLAEIAEIDEI
jgi:hypothetical protein